MPESAVPPSDLGTARASPPPFLPLVLAVAIPAASAAAPPPSPNPFPRLEAEVRREIEYLRSEAEGSTDTAEAKSVRERLVRAYETLHDLRNHEAFLELWNGWKNAPEHLDLLYAGSGSHVAPLVFLFSAKPPREATCTFTEIDPWSAPRLEGIFARLLRGGSISDLRVTYEPGGHPGYRGRWEAALRGPGGEALRTDREAFFRWFRRAAGEVGEECGFRVLFAFRAGGCRARVRLLLNDRDSAEGASKAYREEDLARCDLFVTHSWSGSPRENLGMLWEVANSSRRTARASPPAVMMEDLRRYPYPVDLSFFGIAAETREPYGHLEYVRLPDGTRLPSQDGAALYGGGVLLEPDGRWLDALTDAEIETLFDFLLFAPCPYTRSNVDLFGGEPRSAPPLLDLAAGYGLRTIRGRDLRLDDAYPAKLAEGAIGLLEAPGGVPERYRDRWCALLEEYGAALRRVRGRDLAAYFREAEADRGANPFLESERPRALFEEALRERDLYAALLRAQSVAASAALALLEASRSRIEAGCGGSGPP